MTLHMIPEPAPLTTDDDGVIKVGGTRIPLATVVMAFHQGATAETMVQEYPSLTLADVYAAIGYYLRHQADVDTYLAEQQHEAAVVRQQNEARFSPTGLRSRLLARRSTAIPNQSYASHVKLLFRTPRYRRTLTLMRSQST